MLWHALDSHPAGPWWFTKELRITVGAIGSPLNVRKILDTTDIFIKIMSVVSLVAVSIFSKYNLISFLMSLFK